MAELLQAGYPSCHSTNSFQALKDDSVPDWGQHAATIGQEHCDGCVGCLVPHHLALKQHSSCDNKSDSMCVTA